MSKLLTFVAHTVTRRRALVMGVLLCCLGFLGYQIKSIRADFTPSDLFTMFEGQEQIIEDFQEAFGTSENVVLVLVTADDVLEHETLQFLHDLSLDLKDSEYIARAESVTITPIPRHGARDATAIPLLGDIALGPSIVVDPVIEGEIVTPAERDELQAVLPESPLIHGRLISEAHTVAVVALFLRPELTRIKDFRLAVGSLRRSAGLNMGLSELVVRCQRAAQGLRSRGVPPAGVEVHMAGLPFMRTVVVERFRTDQTLIVPLALFVCLLVLLVTVRWLPGVVFPLAAVAISAVMVVGGMAWFGEPINIVNNIVPALIIIIGISNTIHLISRYREELRHGLEQVVSIERTVRAMTVACFLTSFTTAVGFGSLVISRTELLKRFGVTAAIGVLVSYVVTITLIPVLLSIAKRPKSDQPGTRDGALETAVGNVTRWVMARAKVVLFVVALVFAGAVYLALEKSVVDNSVLDQFDTEDPLVHTTRMIETELEGVMPVEVGLYAEPGRFSDLEVVNAVDGLRAELGELDGVLSATAYTTYLHEVRVLFARDPQARSRPFTDESEVDLFLGMLQNAPRNPLESYLTEDVGRTRVSLRIADAGARRTMELGDEVLAAVDRATSELGGIEVVLTGDAYVNARGLNAVIRDLLGSLLLAVVIIFGFLTLLFRDFRLGILSVPPNLLPLVVTAAYMAAKGIRLNTATAMIFTISIGMAVDATIHLLTRFREEEARASSLDEALIRAAQGTGRAIVLTCVMLMAGFSVMLISKFVPVRLFGELIAVTAFGCLLGNMIVLPALLKVAWNPRPAKKGS